MSSMARTFGAPDKVPARRLATLEFAGELAIPFTTGILIGIGDQRSDQLAALHAIAAAHARHGHVQEVIVQNFLPKPGTAMFRAEPCPPEDLRWAIAAARLVLPPEIHVQAPPNLSDDLAPLLAAGIDVWTTLNVQHLESLVDVVWKITGVRVRETVKGLGLRKLGSTSELKRTPEVEGMVKRLRHLVAEIKE